MLLNKYVYRAVVKWQIREREAEGFIPAKTLGLSLEGKPEVPEKAIKSVQDPLSSSTSLPPANERAVYLILSRPKKRGTPLLRRGIDHRREQKKFKNRTCLLAALERKTFPLRSRAIYQARRTIVLNSSSKSSPPLSPVVLQDRTC